MSLYRVLRYILTHPISGNAKFKSLYRFFYWQLRSLVSKKEIVYKFTPKSLLIVSKGMTGSTGNYYCGLHEYKEMGFLLHLIRPEDIFVDVGANIGSYTLLASAQIGAKSFAFEPVSKTYRQMRNNIEINNLQGRVLTFNMGVSSKSGELFFSNGNDTSMNHVLKEENILESSEKVKVETLDNMLSAVKPTLLKIDVEGFESEVISGAEDLLNKPELKAIIIELNSSGKQYGYTDEAIDEKLKSFGFKSYTYNPFQREIKSISINESDNIIYIRDIEFVKDRIKLAEKIKIFNSSF